MTKPYKALELVTKAIQETGTTELEAIALKLDELVDQELMTNVRGYRRLQSKSKASRIETRQKNVGIYTTGDIEILIKEASQCITRIT